MSSNIFYVYQYLREDGTPFYIGIITRMFVPGTEDIGFNLGRMLRSTN